MNILAPDLRWYALFRETRTYSPGAVLLNFDRDIRDELTERGFSYADYRRTASEKEAWMYFQAHQDRVSVYPEADRYRKARERRYRCWYCGKTLDMRSFGQPDSAELEHQTPRCRQTPEVTADSNKVTSCRECNNPAKGGKGNRTLEEYRQALLEARMPHGQHLFFYGEWLKFVALSRAGRLPHGLRSLACQSFLRSGRGLAFPVSLLLADLEDVTP
ncbi:HNH endonuclease domain-containing protein [Deinococcus budaensis]|uniref:5-methylcytosine-specific restriction endonuclease McrA n=1 Tax=Deinococcus budaensis TaxID=1665626 RepID=A0A7W8GH39_9DEIO|nr:HNH endonuclease domain-containing protein [Deinococcus budaensis]MBB5235515.1 5-methylcytosine-specific restriction endonuclease McrA [Deinococcus budaensis]